ncbi:carboxylate--amine ligase [Haloarchaeobius sp. DT45]|uniref:carboxylate--amine ligase n=1 Tax=Haloarchaeobius sp. DT45 TaxID=3446116 RepID=UPI003F6ADA05
MPAISAPSSLACLRLLADRGIRTVVFSEREDIPAFRSKYCDEAVTVPSPREDMEGYEDAVRSIAMRPDVRTIIPVREEDIYTLAKHKAELSDHVATPWPSFEQLRTVQDRVQLFQAAESAGVGMPETSLLTEVDDWDQRRIVKSRYTMLAEEYVGPGSLDGDRGGTRYLKPGARPDVEGIIDTMGHVPLVQSFVPGADEYGFFAIYDHGEPLATFQHRQRRAWKYCGGPSAFRESIDDPDLDEAGRQLLDQLDWHGLAMVEFKRDPETGEFKLMEINPRFWSSLPFTVQTGADFPYYYWLLAGGDQDQIDHDYEVGIAGHLIRGELLYLKSVLFEEYELVESPDTVDAFADVFSSLVQHPRFDYLDLGDMGPFLRDMRNMLGVGGTKLKGSAPKFVRFMTGTGASRRDVVTDDGPGERND